MNTDARDFLTRLLETPSPSGFEARGQRVWADYVRPHADRRLRERQLRQRLGDAEPRRLAENPDLRHADELGFMVSYINDDGYLSFKGIGGVDTALIRGQRVIVHGKGGPVPASPVSSRSIFKSPTTAKSARDRRPHDRHRRPLARRGRERGRRG